MKIYGDSMSGNCYKIQLTAALVGLKLGQDYQWIELDILNGDTKTPDFTTKNPNGKIPYLEFDNGNSLSESNAIINYLAADSELLPTDKFTLAKVQQWQFFEQYSHEPYIAVARFINKYLNLPDDRLAEYQSKQAGGHRALATMERQLSQSQYLTGDQLTTADISLYAYSHVADEGGFDLSNYPNINAWLTRIANTKQYVAMKQR
ncbi:glutathione S-transferase family protein [Endozoicomonas sp. G2_1]|uniref:glutathione S-transferase family protein n=1 Tax=Endozoicomonas sp. G2_1 TaxID=2821091 RepID=UPI001ADBE776|nr:glutathione S-transferase family protein [Endozoicomonas sp. G2_1]MBO9490433.1 glutathione S-transferase family protein [Endozoicomonas sp. G2_1]